jgi:hypothetical protein
VRSIFPTSMAVITLVSIGGVNAAAAWQGSIAWRIAPPFALHDGGSPVEFVAARLAGTRFQQGFALTSGAVSMLLLARGIGWIA